MSNETENEKVKRVGGGEPVPGRTYFIHTEGYRCMAEFGEDRRWHTAFGHDEIREPVIGFWEVGVGD